MKLAMFLLAAAIVEPADNLGYIVAMYSAKDTRGLGGHFEVSVDGKKAAKLRYGTYYRIPVRPGAYTVTVDAPETPPILCHLVAGESCYIRTRLVGSDNRREAALVSPEEGARQLRNTIPLEKEKIFLPVPN